MRRRKKVVHIRKKMMESVWRTGKSEEQEEQEGQFARKLIVLCSKSLTNYAFFVWNMVGWQLTPYASSQTSHKSKLIPKQKAENKNDGAAHRRKHHIRSPHEGVYMGLARDGWPSSFNKMKYRRKQQIKEREKVFLIKMSLVAFISSFIHYSITCSVFTILIDGSARCLFYLIIIYSAKIFAFFFAHRLFPNTKRERAKRVCLIIFVFSFIGWVGGART